MGIPPSGVTAVARRFFNRAAGSARDARIGAADKKEGAGMVRRLNRRRPRKGAAARWSVSDPPAGYSRTQVCVRPSRLMPRKPRTFSFWPSSDSDILAL